jgi:hypothetical protein
MVRTSMTSDVKDLIAIALPTVIPSATVLVGIISNNKRIDDLNRRMDDLRLEMSQRFISLEHLFDEKLRHMEDVLDAQLKHLEEQ